MRYTLFCCILLCTGPKASAVSRDSLPLNASDRQFVGGIVAGGNICDIVGDYYPGYHKLSPTAGLMVYSKLKDILWLSTELLYSPKGCIGVREVNSPYIGEYFEKYYLRLHYVETPVMINAFVRNTWHLSLGASWSYLFSEIEDIYSDQPYYIDPLKYYSRKMCIDYMLGGGWHLGRRLFFNVRYQRSVLATRNVAQVHPFVGYANYYNRTVSMQLVYMIR